jgi:hypothetical protein
MTVRAVSAAEGVNSYTEGEARESHTVSRRARCRTGRSASPSVSRRPSKSTPWTMLGNLKPHKKAGKEARRPFFTHRAIRLLNRG